MNSKLMIEAEPIQSLKVVNISIGDIQKQLLGDGISQERRLELEGKLHLLNFQKKDLQKKVDKKKNKQTKFYKHLKSDVPMDRKELYTLIGIADEYKE